MVDGFYDGDGSGGQSGNVWKIRFSPDELGIWQWTASSNDPGLNGQSGFFRCIESGKAGPVVSEGRYFRYADGGPVYLIGNFLDRAAPAYEGFSHTLLSEEISESNRQNMIARGQRLARQYRARYQRVFVSRDNRKIQIIVTCHRIELIDTAIVAEYLVTVQIEDRSIINE